MACGRSLKSFFARLPERLSAPSLLFPVKPFLMTSHEQVEKARENSCAALKQAVVKLWQLELANADDGSEWCDAALSSELSRFEYLIKN